ncbi:MAG: hypothetical protein L3J39_05355 [Verrucomicrobiales bacterium]|nr:hypothetical protein [Verrucomicrobiales bacterium]
MRFSFQRLQSPLHIALLFLITVSTGLLAEESRTWTSSDGKEIKGSLISCEGDQLTLKTTRGNFKFPLSRLSKEDQDYVQAWQKKAATADSPKEATKTDNKNSIGNFENLKLGEWPKSVSAEFEIDQIQVVKEDKSGEYIYRSPHFEFRSNVRLSKSVVREFSRIFEATFALVNAIPVGLNAQPSGEGYYVTKLYERKEQYFSDGGMPGSGGMFTQRGGKGMIKIPLPNLGVKNTGTRFIVDSSKRSSTLTHEITHQVMMRWAFLMPVWIREGFAEVTSSQIYSKGRFRLTDTSRAIKDEVTRYRSSQRDFTMINLKDLMTMSHQQWASDLASRRGSINYASANLLLYYFLRIDGEGKGEKLVDYLKARIAGIDGDEASTEILLAGRSYEELAQDVVKGWKSEGLRITFIN